MPQHKRLLWITLLLMILSSVVLWLKVGFPHHRAIAVTLWLCGWIPVATAYFFNRRLMGVHQAILKKKARPFVPHFLVGISLSFVFYVIWVLFPVDTSPLVGMSDSDLRADLDMDIDTYRMLGEGANDLVATFEENGLLQREVKSLLPDEKRQLRSLWRDGVMAFLECEVLCQKYRGFYQLDYLVRPTLHADAFFVAYATYVAQHDACLRVAELVGNDPFMETLLNEPRDGIPPDSFFIMKQRLTHPEVILRLNAAAAYYELVKKDLSIDPDIIADFQIRRHDLFQRLGRNQDLFVDNPLDILERTAFGAWFPVQKQIALRMSYLRTTRRDYFITPKIIAQYRHQFQPGDILLERRNWHLTNVGIPGFWPHTALYVGTPELLETYFAGMHPMDQIREIYPKVYQALMQPDPNGARRCVIESIRPGVVLQSLETSANCDYLGVVRPRLSKPEKLAALLAAFSHFGKPYDLNFDFTTDGSLVCSELVYKAYSAAAPLPFEPEIINGRLLLSPNRMVEQIIQDLDSTPAHFEFVFFLDASEKDDRVAESDLRAFKTSWSRPKWDILQE